MDEKRLSRRQLFLVGASGSLGVALTSGVAGAATSTTGARVRVKGSVHIVAHADDSFLFLAPDVQADMVKGPVLLVVVTAGENALDASYWHGREAGVLAGLARMAGVPDQWTSGTLTLAGNAVASASNGSAPWLNALFLRLPDGNYDGSGFPAAGNQSLQLLWSSAESTITAVDGSATYTAQQLTSLLRAVMRTALPVVVRTQDYANGFGDGDHSDHHAVGRFVQAAFAASGLTRSTLVGYRGYTTTSLPANVTGKKLAAKVAAYLAYAPNDPLVPQNPAALAASNYGPWLSRQYTVS